MDSATDLQPPPDFIDDEDPTVTSAGPWLPATPSAIDWGLARLSALQAEVAELDAQEKAAIARVRARGAHLREKVERGVRFFTDRLRLGAEQNRTALITGKKKSREFLHGVVGWRATKEKLAVKDDPQSKADLQTWLERNPQFARVKIEPDMAALQAHFAATGEIPPGMDHIPAGESFYVKPCQPETGLAVSEAA